LKKKKSPEKLFAHEKTWVEGKGRKHGKSLISCYPGKGGGGNNTGEGEDIKSSEEKRRVNDKKRGASERYKPSLRLREKKREFQGVKRARERLPHKTPLLDKKWLVGQKAGQRRGRVVDLRRVQNEKANLGLLKKRGGFHQSLYSPRSSSAERNARSAAEKSGVRGKRFPSRRTPHAYKEKKALGERVEYVSGRKKKKNWNKSSVALLVRNAME